MFYLLFLVLVSVVMVVIGSFYNEEVKHYTRKVVIAGRSIISNKSIMNKKNILIAGAVLLVMTIGGFINAKRNMPFISKDIAINKGEFIMINWTASESDVETALQWWMKNK